MSGSKFESRTTLITCLAVFVVNMLNTKSKYVTQLNGNHICSWHHFIALKLVPVTASLKKVARF